MKRPTRHYDYSRLGVAMLTLKANPGIWLCRIKQTTFTRLPTGNIVQQELRGISNHYPQIKIGQYQIMPDHLHALVHVVKPLPEGVTLQRVLQAVMEQDGRAIRLTHRFFGARYKPAGLLFDLCSEGRLLELSVAGAFPRFARLDREACLRLNAATGEVATTQWSQQRG